MKGKLAVCSQGFLGVITENEKKNVDYSPIPLCTCGQEDVCAIKRWDDDPTQHGLAYVGIHLGADRAGEPWSSRNPQIIGDAVEAARLL